MKTWRESYNKVKLIKVQISLVRMNAWVNVDHSFGKNILGNIYFMERIFLHS